MVFHQGSEVPGCRVLRVVILRLVFIALGIVNLVGYLDPYGHCLGYMPAEFVAWISGSLPLHHTGLHVQSTMLTIHVH